MDKHCIDDGILLLNKSQNMTSNAALQMAKRLFGAKKAGHTGTLDPMATGMLPLCFGEATKFSQFLLDSDKIYEATGVLGASTNTGDAWGEILQTTQKNQCSNEELLRVLSRFVGKIKQLPPMYSALKYKGKPLYRYARAGQEIPRAVREVEVFNIELLSFDGQQFKIRTRVSKGTYIRTLIEDIGLSLDSLAYMSQLHRVATAGLELDSMYTFDTIMALMPEKRCAVLLPIERMVKDLAKVELLMVHKTLLYQGKSIQISDGHAFKPFQLVAFYDEQGDFFGVGSCEPGGTFKSKRLRRAE